MTDSEIQSLDQTDYESGLDDSSLQFESIDGSTSAFDVSSYHGNDRMSGYDVSYQGNGSMSGFDVSSCHGNGSMSGYDVSSYHGNGSMSGFDVSSCHGNGTLTSHDVHSNHSNRPAYYHDVTDQRSSSSAESQDGATGTGHRKKRVQIITDEHIEELPEYKIKGDTAYKVTFPSSTWNVMMQGFRVALESDTVFMCDYFLGKDVALGVLQELCLFRDGGLFERYMKRAQDCCPPYNYASLFLLEQERTHPKLDTLSLMVYKLASYYSKSWNKVSVELTYYPEGHRKQTIQKKSADVDRKVLKCVYFPNLNWKGFYADPRTGQPAGALTIQTPHKNGTRPMAMDPVFDRLCVFWGNALDHEIAECPQEAFRVVVWIQQ